MLRVDCAVRAHYVFVRRGRQVTRAVEETLAVALLPAARGPRPGAILVVVPPTSKADQATRRREGAIGADVLRQGVDVVEYLETSDELIGADDSEAGRVEHRSVGAIEEASVAAVGCEKLHPRQPGDDEEKHYDNRHRAEAEHRVREAGEDELHRGDDLQRGERAQRTQHREHRAVPVTGQGSGLRG
eukprot:scaffold50930_cov66-Phaeocystis_antarctica.AAC.2